MLGQRQARKSDRVDRAREAERLHAEVLARIGLKPGQSIVYDYEVDREGVLRKIGRRIIDGP